MAYDTKSIGISTDEVKPFTKPIMMLTLMFFGMVPAIFFWGIQQYFTVPEKKDKVPFKTFVILIIPSVCDLLCTLLLLIAQLYITASLWQMMRGSIIIITALMKRFALNHRLKFHMWLGVGFITLGTYTITYTSFLLSSTLPSSVSSPSLLSIHIIITSPPLYHLIYSYTYIYTYASLLLYYSYAIGSKHVFLFSCTRW